MENIPDFRITFDDDEQRDFVLPSGRRVVIREVRIGNIGPLEESVASGPDGVDLDALAKRLVNTLQLFSQVTTASIVDPPLVGDENEPGEGYLTLQEIPLADRLALFEEALRRPWHQPPIQEYLLQGATDNSMRFRMAREHAQGGD
jgi:hypothetical protein